MASLAKSLAFFFLACAVIFPSLQIEGSDRMLFKKVSVNTNDSNCEAQPPQMMSDSPPNPPTSPVSNTESSGNGPFDPTGDQPTTIVDTSSENNENSTDKDVSGDVNNPDEIEQQGMGDTSFMENGGNSIDPNNEGNVNTDSFVDPNYQVQNGLNGEETAGEGSTDNFVDPNNEVQNGDQTAEEGSTNGVTSDNSADPNNEVQNGLNGDETAGEVNTDSFVDPNYQVQNGLNGEETAGEGSTDNFVDPNNEVQNGDQTAEEGRTIGVTSDNSTDPNNEVQNGFNGDETTTREAGTENVTSDNFVDPNY